jgi:hypothetical protein
VVPSSSSTLLCTQPTSTTLFPVLSKLTGSVLSFEDLTDNSIVRNLGQLYFQVPLLKHVQNPSKSYAEL